MKGCIFVTRKDSRRGFSLVGFQQIIADRDDILEVMKKIVAEQDPGMVFIDERLVTTENEGRMRFLEKQWGGAFISLPAPGRGDEETEDDSGHRFIARVLGYQMKLS